MAQSSKPRKKYISRGETLKRVERELRYRVAAKVWTPGSLLPGRRALAVEFGIDLHTLQRAITPLLEDGTLRADGGRGTFVSDRVDLEQDRSSFVYSNGSANGSSLSRLDGVRYQANALSLGTLGIITAYNVERRNDDDIAGVGSQATVRSLERAFGEAGGKIIVYNLLKEDGRWETVPEATEHLVRMGVDALAVIGIDKDPILRDVKMPEWFSQSIPVVHISGEGDFQSPVHVYYDNRQAGLQAADHLLSIGCESIVFLVPFTVPWLDDRIEGARIALRQAGHDPGLLQILPANHPLVQWSSQAASVSDEAIKRAFDEDLLVGGVIAPNDAVAHQVLRHAQIRGKVVGKDFALIGFDDIPSSSFAGLTSLRPPFEEMGREAASLLVRMLSGDKVSLNLCLPSLLTVRSSTYSYTPQVV